MRWRYGDATATASKVELADGSEIIVKGSAKSCIACKALWRTWFPNAPEGCSRGVDPAADPPVFFDFETGKPAECAEPSPDIFNVTALRVLEVLGDCSGQMTGEGGSVSIDAALQVYRLRFGGEPDTLFLDLWRAACDELQAMRSETLKRQMDKR